MSSLYLNTADAWPFVLRLHKYLFMNETLNKGQMHVRMFILCFVIEGSQIEHTVLFLKCTASVQCVFGTLTVGQLIRNFPACYEVRIFINNFKISKHLAPP